MERQSILGTDEEISTVVSNNYRSSESSSSSSSRATSSLPLAHYSNNKNNTSQNFRELDIIIAKAMSIPGSDASYQLKKKYSKATDDFERIIGKAGQMIEMTGKALTSNLVISFYKIDTSSATGVQHLKNNMEELFLKYNPSLSPMLLSQLQKWLDSKFFADYLKYYRDFRTDISKNWFKIFLEKPAAWIRNALDNTICYGDEPNLIYPYSVTSSLSYSGSIDDKIQSLFGITGL